MKHQLILAAFALCGSLLTAPSVSAQSKTPGLSASAAAEIAALKKQVEEEVEERNSRTRAFEATLKSTVRKLAEQTMKASHFQARNVALEKEVKILRSKSANRGVIPPDNGNKSPMVRKPSNRYRYLGN